MGDIQRKLGKLPESEQAYRKAIEILEPLAAMPAAKLEAESGTGPYPYPARLTCWSEAATRARPSRSTNRPLEAQQSPRRRQDATTEDRLRLGQTLKKPGRPAPAERSVHAGQAGLRSSDRVLEQALADRPKQLEIRNDLALATDARGWINRELGDLKAAGQDYRRALDLLEKLVAEFPTVPRYRESLAKACNSLGLLEETTGSLVEAETLLPPRTAAGGAALTRLPRPPRTPPRAGPHLVEPR